MFDESTGDVRPLAKERNTVKLSDDDPGQSAWIVSGLHIMPNGPTFAFDDFRIEGQPKRFITVGAVSGADIVLADTAVSAKHCLIERRRDRVLVHDCRSTNGTRANGVVVDKCVLSEGILLTLGRTTLLAYGPRGVDERVLLVASTMFTFLHGAMKTHGTLRRAAQAIGVQHSTLADWIKKKFKKRPSTPRKGRK
ncbi:MAG: FHA domain-containing protein [Proteobacteria bacterium]|nr:FHA domain-containing protein [Pseudomonadota bacterium]